MTREWRPVVGHEGAYEVSDDGQVRSLDRIIVDRNGRSMRFRGRPLDSDNAYQFPSGRWHYSEVVLSLRQRAKVHQVVLAAFHGPRPDGLLARHLNGNGSDNRAANLRWGTASENMLDRTAHGTCPAHERSTCPGGHLLSMPNLRGRVPYRACLACTRAANAAHLATKAGKPFDRKAYADAAYARIMGAAA